MNSLPNLNGSAACALLIVEDHAVVRASLRDWLTTHFPAYPVLEAASGEDAVTLAAQQPLCLVVMDVGLPGMTGIEATRQIKRLQPQASVVVISIHEAPAYRADALSAGASAFVPKYNMHADLSRVLHRLLAETPGSRPDANADDGRPAAQDGQEF